MSAPRYFITGASGCIGHYLLESLLNSTTATLHLLLRTPKKLHKQYHDNSRIIMHEGGLEQIAIHQQTIKQCDVVIHIATAWHDDNYAMTINYEHTLELMTIASQGQCQKIIYFSTASILGRDNRLNPNALKLGAMYIKSKYRAHQKIQSLTTLPPVYTVFPTLVLGGSATIPYSHISSGLKEHHRYASLLRFFSINGAFHFIHGRDIAEIVQHLVLHDVNRREFVLGQARLTTKQAIQEISNACGKKVYWQLPLNNKRMLSLAKLARIKIDPWGEYCAINHEQTYTVTNPSDFNRTNHFPTLQQAVQDIEGIVTKAVVG